MIIVSEMRKIFTISTYHLPRESSLAEFHLEQPSISFYGQGENNEMENGQN